MQNRKIYKDTRVTFYVPDELGAKIRREANKQGRGVSSFCAYIVKKYIEENEK